jgi:hypothetical protein
MHRSVARNAPDAVCPRRQLTIVIPKTPEEGSAELFLGSNLRGNARTGIAWRPSSSEEHHDRGKPKRCDLPCRLNPPDARHANVHQHQIGPKTLGLLDAVLAAARSPNPFEPSRRIDHRVSGIVEHDLVVNDQNPDRRVDTSRDRHPTILAGAAPPVDSTRMCKWCERARLRR